MGWKTKMQHFVVLGAFRLITLLPLKVLFLLSEIITFFVYHLIGYRKKIVITNLKNAFPNRSEKEIRHIARKYYRHLSVMMVENIHLRFVTDKQFKKHLVFENKALIDDLYRKGKNLIVMLGHLGNWEMAAGLTRFVDYQGAAVYKKLSSPVFEKLYFDIRKRVGVEPVEMRDVMRYTIKRMQQKSPFMLFMVADQAPLKSEALHWLGFLNQDTSVFMGSEKLARKFDMPVVYADLLRQKKGVYKMSFSLITDTPKLTKEMEITRLFFHYLQQSIEKSPRYWLWSHRRWKYTKSQTPSHAKKG